MTQTIELRLPDEVAEQARSLGLLTDEKLTEMIEAEIWRKRQAAWAELRAMTEGLRADFRAEYGHLSDEEAQAMIDQWINESGQESDVNTAERGS
jgi:post-segregation antitoxin (ccd killing protein)